MKKVKEQEVKRKKFRQVTKIFEERKEYSRKVDFGHVKSVQVKLFLADPKRMDIENIISF